MKQSSDVPRLRTKECNPDLLGRVVAVIKVRMAEKLGRKVNCNGEGNSMEQEDKTPIEPFVIGSHHETGKPERKFHSPAWLLIWPCSDASEPDVMSKRTDKRN